MRNVGRKRFTLKRIARVLACLTGACALGLVVLGLVVEMPGEKRTPAGYARNESQYLTMRDGVRIAIDVWYPPRLAREERIPAVMRATRYWRAAETRFPYRILYGLGRAEPLGLREAVGFNEAGYALVTVDVRGSGASFGQRPIEYSPDETADLGEVADWITGQPWSNGNVGTYGVSYDGNTAELAAVPNSPVVKAVAPQYNDFDPLMYLAMPGGVFDSGFIRAWNNGNQALDANDLPGAMEATGFSRLMLRALFRGVKAVDEDRGRVLLAEAVAGHKTADLYTGLLQRTYRDDAVAQTGQTAEQISPYGLKKEIEGSGVPMYVWVSWMDAGTVDGALSRYLTFSNPQKVIIGAWSHGGEHDADPFRPADAPPDPPVSTQLGMLLAFFDRHLKDPPALPGREIRYYVMGSGQWKTTPTWPPAGVTPQRWYFQADHGLAPGSPEINSGADAYTVDYAATTGPTNRWHTQLAGDDVVYPDRALEDRKLLAYTSALLQTDTEITGTPLVTLYVSSTASDGACHVYLEDVAPDGRVTYVTEGMLRALHRKVSEAPPPYVQLGPYHTFARADGQYLVPGEIAELRFSLYTTSVLIKKDHRIRVAIAGHDASMFARYPETGTPVLTLYRSSLQASSIELPISR
ncbi:MAG: CocE/NonD family hydrolase [Candidatus Hydrogenedentes bacterium]|nr:CocE/NonD family hydrolase [Candidatus Hydrogenedentota bacterium]